MAKTKGSNPPVRELLYEDAGGILHYFGEFFRGIFKEGYISPDDPAVDITGVSTRGERPTQQGTGSPSQEEIRSRYKNCITLWHSLPLACPVPLPDPPPTSKESVWEAKQEHGVVCSYYDLFMRCCLKWARDHDNEMPDGDCFPCISLCNCDGILIGYTTTTMAVGEQQTLSVLDPLDGCTYLWEITSGGGSLSSPDGLSVVYTAPINNDDCLQNPTISLSIGSEVCDALSLGINGYTLLHNAYRIVVCVQDKACWINGTKILCSTVVQYHYFFCSDVFRYAGHCYSSSVQGYAPQHTCPDFCDMFPDILTCAEGTALKGCGDIGTIVDVRTPYMIAHGCCPGGLL